MTFFSRRAALAALALAGAASATASFAQDAWPSRPVRIIIPGAPGSGTEVATRVLAEQLSTRLGQNFIVESRPGADGRVGAQAAARSPKDGYTLFMGTIASLSLNEHLFSELGYDPDKDFEPVFFTGFIPMIVAVHPSAPYRTLTDLVEAAKAKPETVNVALPSTTSKLVFEVLQQEANVKLFAVPFNQTGSGINNVVAGQIPVLIDTVAGTRALIEGGRLRALAVTSPASTSLLPGVKSAAEQGLPGLQVTAWNVISVPSGVPPQVRQKLHATMQEILKDASYRTKLLAVGFEPALAAPAKPAQDEVRAERARWGKLIKDRGIKP
ncbi:Bug family tripartite tricarboxylate transporter substrate binding protein [Ramlibacter sp.]|uniref:Bug family tripartite tricarboxylate transporter substrate binding protein n=1 Tax=Ramlibacter sp. TaxID=1917967 RepID=UPI003D09B1F5